MQTEEKFQSLASDLCFKNVFSKEIILRDFIDSFFKYLHINTRFAFLNIKSQKYIMPKNKKYIGYIGDIVATLDNNTILSLEMYKDSFKEKHYNKSYAYMCRLFDQNIENSKTYKAKKIISLNLIYGNYRRNNNELVNKHLFNNVITQIPSDNGNTIMYLINLDKLKNIPYTNSKNRFINWLKLINAKTLEEMEAIGKDDEIMNEAIEFVRKWNDKTPEENLNNYIKGKQKEAYQDGEEEKTFEIAKNLLFKNIPIETIIEVTGLSKSELNSLQNEK